MDALTIIGTIEQLIQLFPEAEAMVGQAIADFKSLFANGASPSQNDIDAIIARVKSQSEQIQAES